MAQTMSKQLGEFLQEQQEPFALDLFLIERGLLTKAISTPDHDFRCFSVNSSHLLKRSASCGAKKRKKTILGCSKFVKAVLSKLVTISHDQKFKSDTKDQGCSKNGQGNNSHVDDDNFSSASCTTVFNSCSDISDREEDGDNLSKNDDTSPRAVDCENQVFEDDRKIIRLDILEESKQLSPVSVLAETESSDEESPDLKRQECLKGKNLVEEFSGPSISKSGETSPESQYIYNKKAILQTKQLLFDCIREVVENERSKNSKGEDNFQRILGSEELWELLLDNIRLWSQTTINETNINHLMHFDVLNSFEMSTELDKVRETIGLEISDLIFEDISNDIVMDMFNSSTSSV